MKSSMKVPKSIPKLALKKTGQEGQDGEKRESPSRRRSLKGPLQNSLKSRFSNSRLRKRLTRPDKTTHSLASMLPNITTILALCTGLSSLRFALLGHWEWAVASILIAAILDTLDGRLARLLGSSSRFGAELDSFSDFVSFGVCPSILLYLWSLHSWGGGGWILSLFFTVCSALRLARFNVWSIEGRSPSWAQGFFVGVPAPAAAILGLSPLILWLGGAFSFWQHPVFCALSMVLVGLLMVSQLPTYSFKKTSIPAKWVLPLLLLVGLLGASLFAHFWGTVIGLIVAYIFSFPFSYSAYCKVKAKQENPA